jgi:3'-phosphoadenosine 5'-phosphosulfate sulfotransferase (PAPS reductase)/FAD synthetase
MAAQEEFSLSQEDFTAKAATKSYLAKPGRNPFLIDEPTVISFSGGRTSAYMLWRVLEANGGLPEDAIVCFANTGKEEEDTLEFVRDCEVNWGVEIHWLEYRAEKQVARTNFETASRNGEPFETIIKERKMLPNTRARFCTVELKIRTVKRYLQSIGWDEWLNMIGIRHDEQRRVVKMQPDSKADTPIMPLADAGVTKADVLDFWASQPFDLKLPVINGETIGGNCDLCFLKALPKIITLVAQKPERAIWWAKMEDWAQTQTSGDGNKFRIDRPRYADIHKFIDRQSDMFEDSIECFCGD